MGKRKEEDDAEAIEPKKVCMEANLTSVFTSTEFLKTVKDPDQSIEAIKRFCQSTQQDFTSVGSYDIINSYLTVSPECSELFKCLEATELTHVELSIIFEAFVKILLRTTADLETSFSIVGVTITKRILQGHLFKIYGALSGKKPPNVIVAALRLLTAMIMQGKACALDVALNLSLGGKVFEDLSTYKQEEKHFRFGNVRLCYIRFVLSFFMAGDLKTFQNVLDSPGFVGAVFRGLPDDPAPHILLFLSTLLEKVVSQLHVPKTSKVKLLSRRGVLTSVARLLQWGDSPAQEDREAVRELAYDFLYRSCCPFKSGINFRDPEWGTSSKCGNPVLLRFLLDLDRTPVANDLARRLVVEVFKSCPDLLRPYFAATSLSFEPRNSERYFANCQLVHDIYDNQPPVPPALMDASKFRPSSTPPFEPAKIAAMTTPGIIAAVFDRAMLKSMLTHCEDKVREEALHVMAAALARLSACLAHLRDDEKWGEAVYTPEHRRAAARELQDSVRKHLPAVMDIVSVWGSAEAPVDDTKSKLLHVLSLYQKTLPEAFAATTFDFCGLLPSFVADSRPGGRSLLHLVHILAASVRQRHWFKMNTKKRTPFYCLIRILMDLLRLRRDRDLIDATADLLVKISDQFSVVGRKSVTSELLIWLRHLPREQLDDDDDFLIRFFEKSVFRISKSSLRYKSRLAALLERFEGKTGVESTSEVSKWCKELPPFSIEKSSYDDHPSPEQSVFGGTSQEDVVSLLVMSYFEHLTLHRVTEKPDLTVLLDVYFSGVLSDLLHLQAYSGSLDRFAFVASSLASEIPSLPSFPRLSELIEDASWWRSLPTVVLSRDGAATLPCREAGGPPVDSAPIALRIDRLSARHDADAAIRDTCFECACVEGRLAEMLFLLRACLALSSASLGEPCSDLCEKMQSFIARIRRVAPEETPPEDVDETSDDVDETSDDVDETPPDDVDEKSLHDDDSSELSGSESSDDDDITQPQDEHCTEAEAEYRHTMDDPSFVELMERLLSSDVLRAAFLSRLGPRCAVARLHALLSAVLSSAPGSPVSAYYLDRLSTVMAGALSGREGATPLREVTLRCFDALQGHMDHSHLTKILTAATSCAKSDSFAIPIVISCLNLLLAGPTGIPVAVVEGLFDVLTGEGGTPLLPAVLALLKASPSLSLFAPETVVTWCLRHIREKEVAALLEMLSSQSPPLRTMLIDSLVDSLPEAPDSKKRLLHRVVASVIDRGGVALLSAVKASYAKLVLADLASGTATPAAVSVIKCLLAQSKLSKKYFKQLCSKLPALLEDDVILAERWEVARSCLDFLRRRSDEEAESFRLRLVDSLLTFTCKSFKRDGSFVPGAVGRLSLLLLDKEQLPGTLCKAGRWNNFLKQALKYQLSTPSVLDAVCRLLELLHADDAPPTGLIGCSQLRRMIMSHSGFLDIMAEDSKEEDAKTPLVRLLYVLTCRCAKEDLQRSDHLVLLVAFRASLSECDQYIFQTMLLYESLGVSPEDYKPFLWGKSALASYPSSKKQAETLYHKPAPERVLGCFDEEMMTSTLDNFPIRRRMVTAESFLAKDPKSFAPTRDPVSTDANAGDRYNPAFVLGVVSELLSPVHLVNCRLLVEHKVVSFLFMCLASHCPFTRRIALDCLTSFYEHLQTSRFADRGLLAYLIGLVRSGVKLEEDESVVKQTSIIAAFLSQATQLLLQPTEHAYVVVNRFLLVKPSLDMKDIPEFYHTFFSSSLDYKAERSWILSLILLGIRDKNDFHVAERRQLFRILMCFFESSVSDNKSRRIILQVSPTPMRTLWLKLTVTRFFPIEKLVKDYTDADSSASIVETQQPAFSLIKPRFQTPSLIIIEKVCSIRGATFALIHNQLLLPWLLNITLLQRDKSITHDSGSYVSKREDSTLQICSVIGQIWKTVAPPTSDTTNHEGKRRRVICLREQFLRQLADVCFELLLNLLRMCGRRASPELLSSFHLLLETLSGVFEHANPPTGDALHRHDDESRMFSLPTRQARTVMRSSMMVESCSGVAPPEALLVVTYWIPRITELSEPSACGEVLAWGVETFNKVKVERSKVLGWLISWLHSLPAARSGRLTRALIRLFEDGADCRNGEEDHATEYMSLLQEVCTLVGASEPKERLLASGEPKGALMQIYGTRKSLLRGLNTL